MDPITSPFRTQTRSSAEELYVLEPLLVKKPWGIGDRAFFNLSGVRPPEPGIYGEIWTASAQDLDIGAASSNRVSASKKGRESSLLSDLVRKYGTALLGEGADALLKSSPKRGKTESWYIRKVVGNVKIITGLQSHITRERFERMIAEGYFHQTLDIDHLEADLVTTEVAREGDTYIVKAGTLHTIWPLTPESYVVIDELQQGFGSSLLPTLSKVLLVRQVLSLQVHPDDHRVAHERRPDVARRFAIEPTIRVSDFGRGRDIQPELTPELIDFGNVSCSRTSPLVEELNNQASRTHLLANQQFAKDRYVILRGGVASVRPDSFSYRMLHVSKGSARVVSDRLSYDIRMGQTLLLPAWTPELLVIANEDTEFLVDYVPDLRNKVAHLTKAGFAYDEIIGLDGDCAENDIVRYFEAASRGSRESRGYSQR
jgi:mannose-6-phosphate isomerase class I